MKTTLLSLIVCGIVCAISLFVTRWMGLTENWSTLISVFLGIILGLASKRMYQQRRHS